jgi:ATP-binding protein involved in chromosome partitioning
MPITENMILNALRGVNDPELRHNVVELGFIQDIDIVENDVHVSIQLTTPHCPFADAIVAQMRDAVLKVPGIGKVTVERACLKEA